MLRIAFALALAATQGSAPPRASDPIQAIAFLLGNWESHEKTKDASGKEITFVLQGVNTLALDGKAIQIDESFEVQGRCFANHLLITFDPSASGYRAWWFTAGQPSKPLLFQGIREPNRLTLTTDDGKIRVVYDEKSPDHFDAVLEVKRGDKWEPSTTAVYHRKGSS